MKFRQNEKNQIEVQLKAKQPYYLVFHRLNYGKYETYIKTKDKEYIFTLRDMKQLKKFIEETKI